MELFGFWFFVLVLGWNKIGDLQGDVENLFWPVHVKEHAKLSDNIKIVIQFWNFKPLQLRYRYVVEFGFRGARTNFGP